MRTHLLMLIYVRERTFSYSRKHQFRNSLGISTSLFCILQNYFSNEKIYIKYSLPTSGRWVLTLRRCTHTCTFIDIYKFTYLFLFLIYCYCKELICIHRYVCSCGSRLVLAVVGIARRKAESFGRIEIMKSLPHCTCVHTYYLQTLRFT